MAAQLQPMVDAGDATAQNQLGTMYVDPALALTKLGAMDLGRYTACLRAGT